MRITRRQTVIELTKEEVKKLSDGVDILREIVDEIDEDYYIGGLNGADLEPLLDDLDEAVANGKIEFV